MIGSFVRMFDFFSSYSSFYQMEARKLKMSFTSSNRKGLVENIQCMQSQSNCNEDGNKIAVGLADFNESKFLN